MGASTAGGFVSVHIGSPAGVSHAPSLTLAAPRGSLILSDRVSYAGDVDGDGRCDLLASSPSAAGHGAAFVFLNSTAGIALTPSVTLPPPSTSLSAFGTSIAWAPSRPFARTLVCVAPRRRSVIGG